MPSKLDMSFLAGNAASFTAAGVTGFSKFHKPYKCQALIVITSMYPTQKKNIIIIISIINDVRKAPIQSLLLLQIHQACAHAFHLLAMLLWSNYFLRNTNTISMTQHPLYLYTSCTGPQILPKSGAWKRHQDNLTILIPGRAYSPINLTACHVVLPINYSSTCKLTGRCNVLLMAYESHGTQASDLKSRPNNFDTLHVYIVNVPAGLWVPQIAVISLIHFLTHSLASSMLSCTAFSAVTADSAAAATNMPAK